MTKADMWALGGMYGSDRYATIKMGYTRLSRMPRHAANDAVHNQTAGHWNSSGADVL
jgi:hypothetical protein